MTNKVIQFITFSMISCVLANNIPCDPLKCRIENNCRCSSSRTPLPRSQTPQLIAITVSESIVPQLYNNYWEKLFFNRLNPDNSSISMTYFVNHEYTDYELVQKLYVQGYEIGVHSVTRNGTESYWKNLTVMDLIEEFEGQRQIISTFANIPKEDIVGARTPLLALNGDHSIDAYNYSGLSYDNSWPTPTTVPLYPYTLDYQSGQECDENIMNCPEESHPGFWIAPITNIKGRDGRECNSLQGCLVDGNSTEIAAWLMGEIDRVKQENRAPIVLRLDSSWFDSVPNSYDGFSEFLNNIHDVSDVFFVSVKDVVDWVKNPVPLDEFRTPRHDDRQEDCLAITCKLAWGEDDVLSRYMRSCVPCPKVYPWKGNPFGNITDSNLDGY